GMHLCLHPANNTVYKHVCDAQYYADSPVLPVEFFATILRFLMFTVEMSFDASLVRISFNYALVQNAFVLIMFFVM
ncbi:hypothetical protein L9F63_025681, partial [Diploptera punctata]